MSKKLFLYEVDPLFFYDANNDGFGDFKGLSKKRKEYINVTGKIRLKLPKDSYVHTKEGNEGHFINCKENRNENYIEVTREGLDVLLNDIFKSN